MSLKLYAPYGNTRAIKVLIAAELANVELEFVDIPFKDFKSPEHLRRFISNISNIKFKI
jgi:glutathione S-transferase